MNSAKSPAKKSWLQTLIKNKSEREKVIFIFTISFLLVVAGLIYIPIYKHSLPLDSKIYEGNFKELGSIARIGFFAALAIYPIFLLLKWKPLSHIKKGNFELKPLIQFLAKYVRQWHVPIALISTALIILHGYMALIKGFQANFTYFSGIITMAVLACLLVMGVKRYKRTDKKWHFKFAISFLVLFMIHATFS
ncbi:hypothetical protein ACRBU7_15605 [Priestia aryabhattai]|uniref:hypothetical protein n=1 Tax=Priestia aryabhattai TaxID=412384 RepID=UPI003D7F3DCF